MYQSAYELHGRVFQDLWGGTEGALSMSVLVCGRFTTLSGFSLVSMTQSTQRL